MTFALRAARADDYHAIASWIPDAQSCIRWAGPLLAFPFEAGDLETLLAKPDSRSYCLDNGAAEPAAFGQHWCLTPDAVHLGRIIVSPRLRGQGCGHALMSPLIEAAQRDTGRDIITLRVRRDNEAARRLYSALGFEPADEASDERALFMRLLCSSE